jgi:hypothetical protein
MSRVQGFFPLFLATAFGVANGIFSMLCSDEAQNLHDAGVWVFGPAFKEQRENEVFPKFVRSRML